MQNQEKQVFQVCSNALKLLVHWPGLGLNHWSELGFSEINVLSETKVK